MTPFGCYLETLRRSRRLQQKQLAAMLDVDPTYISLMERGRKGPPSTTLIEKLIQCLSMTGFEQSQLREYVAQSQRSLTLPNNMALPEYALLRRLWLRLGSLSPCQIEIINSALKMSDEQPGVHPMSQLELGVHGM